MGFEQAARRIEKETEFEELRSAITRALGADKAGKFLKQVQSSNSRVRDLEAVLGRGVLEKVDEVLSKSGKTAQGVYASLPVSDQAQMREFYLSRIEEVDPKLRAKFQKLYSYY